MSEIETLDADDIESLAELKHLFEKEEIEQDQFIGEFDYAPDNKKYSLNQTYRNSNTKSIYINTVSGWKLYLSDGAPGKDGKETRLPSGGGVGINELNRVLDERLANYTPGTGGSSEAINISLSGTFVNTSATNVENAIKDIDSVISRKVLLGEYVKNDFFEQPDYMYVGYQSLDDKWYVKRVHDLGSEIILRYANISNNPLITDYSTAISNRETLTYDMIGDIDI